jgi:pentatricopeptide repeat protein
MLANSCLRRALYNKPAALSLRYFIQSTSYANSSSSSSTLRIQPSVEPDVEFQKNMNQTARARSAMQLMAAAERGQYASCLAIAAKMKKDRMPPDYSTYSALIQAAAREANWLDAWAIFDDMLLVGVQPTATIFNHLLHVRYAASRVLCSLPLCPAGSTVAFFPICLASH